MVLSLNYLDTWEYGCGFKRSQNESHVFFTSYLTYVETDTNATNNLISFALKAPHIMSTVLEQKVSCIYEKVSYAGNEGLVSACEKCLRCYLGNRIIRYISFNV